MKLTAPIVVAWQEFTWEPIKITLKFVDFDQANDSFLIEIAVWPNIIL